jgi:hypothetical protein
MHFPSLPVPCMLHFIAISYFFLVLYFINF